MSAHKDYLFYFVFGIKAFIQFLATGSTWFHQWHSPRRNRRHKCLFWHVTEATRALWIWFFCSKPEGAVRGALKKIFLKVKKFAEQGGGGLTRLNFPYIKKYLKSSAFRWPYLKNIWKVQPFAGLTELFYIKKSTTFLAEPIGGRGRGVWEVQPMS